MSNSLAPSVLPVPSRAARRRVWIGRLGSAGALIGLALLGAWAWRDDDLAPEQREQLPAFIMEHPSITVRKDGVWSWHFDAAQIEPSPDGSQTFARKLSNGVLFRADKPVLRLRAARARLDNNTSNVEASGGVQAQASDANRFSVSSIVVRWNYALKTLSCPLAVEAQLRDFHFHAPRLDYNWESGDLTCAAPVELRAPGVEVKATRFKASTKTRLLELGGGTRMSFDPQTARPNKWRDLLSLP